MPTAGRKGADSAPTHVPASEPGQNSVIRGSWVVVIVFLLVVALVAVAFLLTLCMAVVVVAPVVVLAVAPRQSVAHVWEEPLHPHPTSSSNGL